MQGFGWSNCVVSFGDLLGDPLSISSGCEGVDGHTSGSAAGGGGSTVVGGEPTISKQYLGCEPKSRPDRGPV